MPSIKKKTKKKRKEGNNVYQWLTLLINQSCQQHEVTKKVQSKGTKEGLPGGIGDNNLSSMLLQHPNPNIHLFFAVKLHCSLKIIFLQLSESFLVLNYMPSQAPCYAYSSSLYSEQGCPFSDPHPENMISKPFNTDFFKDNSQFRTFQVFYTLTTTHKSKCVYTQIP